MDDELSLPDWNSGLWHEQAAIDCSPVKQPLAQVTLKDGNTQRVTALGRPGAAPGAAAAAMPAFVAAPPPARPHQLGAPGAGHHSADGGVADAPPGSASRRTHTPSRTGLKARAVRPSRLGLTPGGKQPELFAVPAGTASKPAAAAAAGTLPQPTTGGGGGLKSILKRLNFSGTKARGMPSIAAGGASTVAAAAAPRQPAGPAAQSTIKQLRFDAGATPAAGTTTDRHGGARHVTFDAATVSPAARTRHSCPGSAAGAASAALPFTPEPTIREEDSVGSDDAPGGGSVNSAAAGHTPYDKRLSSLFRKYQEAGTPELGEAELDALVEGGAVRSPSWKRLSSASVPESIRELAKKYDSDTASLRGLTPPDAPTLAAPALGGADGEAATPVAARVGGEGRSPTLDPTPHHMLDGLMQRNDLYESPPPTQPLGSAAPPSQPPPTQPLAGDASPSPAAPLSPASAVASLLGPLLRATINDIEAEQAQQQPAPASASSPAEFYGFPPMDTPATAGAATPASAAPSSDDGVPRDADGVPTATPNTVTVRRGSYRSSLGVLEEEDDLAANLFSSFTPSESGASPAGASPAGGLVADFAGFSAAPQDVEAGTAGSPADTPGSDFSFFPTAAASAGAASYRQTPAEGATPELAGAAPAGVGISPEILGYYEQQAAAQRAAASTAKAPRATAGPSSSQAGSHPTMMPRSIIKSGRPLAESGTPVLGHAQRGEAPPPTTITRELQALMADLRLEDPGALEQMGTVSALSPVRATGSLRGFLGGLARAITPVRRSARTRTPAKPLEAMLEETGYSYVPNAAMMHGDATPLVEAAEAKAARQAARQTGGVGDAGLPEVASATPGTGRRYSTRGAARAESAAPEALCAEDGVAAAASTPTADMAITGTRLSLRQLRTPLSRAHAAAEPATPAADVPVAQDASPHLAESPSSFAAQASSAAAAAGTPAAAPRSGYSLRSSTAKKERRKLSTPKGTPKAQDSSIQEQQQRRGNSATPPQMSPTEQGIRASLRRSARKSRTAQ